MSYLATQRFSFVGRFQAAPSTVNNIITNYDPANFGPGTEPSWNPTGNHAFTLITPGNVTFAQMANGSKAALNDAIWGLQVRPGSGPPAKIVDLDPQQQLVSTIFGLSITLRQGGAVLLRAKMAAAPFTDIWSRGTTGRGDERAAATYQSTLEELQWGDLSASPFLQELRARAVDGLLSLKFNLDGYSMDNSQTDKFTQGRLVGTIGVAHLSEPRHFVRGRQLNSVVDSNPNGFLVPRDKINYSTAFVDVVARKVIVDLGNALPTNPSGGAAQNIGELSLVCEAAGQLLELGTIDYLTPTWYENNGGISDLPAERQLTDAELAAIATNPLALIREQGNATITAIRETAGGAHVRADLFVSRLNPGEETEIQYYASRFGAPLPNAKIEVRHREFGASDPPMAVPQSALTFPATVECDAQGRATVRLRANDPGNPRRYIDGQVYYVDYALAEVGALNPSDFLSVLVWDAYVPENHPTWHGSMQRIFAQYANLYPKMNEIVNMASYEAVAASRSAMLDVLQRSETDAHYMPVTRDLSAAKRQAMIQWFTDVGADGKPLLGTPTPEATGLTRRAEASLAVTKLAPADEDAGTKTQAARDLAKLRSV